MRRHIHEIRKRLAEQRRLSHHNHTHHQLIGETTTMERMVIKMWVPKAVSNAVIYLIEQTTLQGQKSNANGSTSHQS